MRGRRAPLLDTPRDFPERDLASATVEVVGQTATPGPLAGPVHGDDVAVTDSDIPEAVTLDAPPEGRGVVSHDLRNGVDLVLEIVSRWGCKARACKRQERRDDPPFRHAKGFHPMDGHWGLIKCSLERVAFIRIHTTCSNLLISHVREAQNRFPLLSNML